MATSVRFFVVGLVLLSAALGAVASAAEPDGPEIVALLSERARAFEQQYVGSFSKRKATTKVTDRDDGELRSTVEVEVDVWEYNGEHPTRKVHKCPVDGEDVALEKCNEPPRLEPAYRIFAKDADEHYTLEYGGPASWEGRDVHRIYVRPREDTERHLKGNLFVLKESFLLAGMDVTLADYPFGLKDLSIQMTFAEKGGTPVLDHGRTVAEIYVPFVVNDRRVTEFRASDQKLLEERSPAP